MNQPLDEDKLLEIVGLLYDGCMDPQVWEAAYLAVGQAYGAHMGGLQRYDHGQGRGVMFRPYGMDDHHARTYAEHYCHTNIWKTRRGTRPGVPGEILLGSDVVPERELLGSEFYEWLRTQDDARWPIAVVLDRSGDIVTTVTWVRSGRWGDFTRVERRFLERLHPHLQRAQEVERRFHEVHAERDVGLSLLDRVDAGVLLLSTDGAIVHANNSGRELLQESDGIRALRGRLAFASSADDSLLCSLLALATRGRGGGRLSVARPPPRKPLSLSVVPLPGGFGRARIVVFVTDPGRGRITAGEALRAVYGLTPAEARLARRLASGEGLREAAEALAISRETARTYLKRVFAKTGTSRQVELLLLLTRDPEGVTSAAGVPHPPSR